MGERWRSVRWGAAWVWAVALVACGPTGRDTPVSVTATPNGLDFAEQAVGSRTERAVTLAHDADRPVQVFVEVLGAQAAGIEPVRSTLEVPPGAGADLRVAFAPDRAGQAWGRLRIAPGEGPAVEVAVRGQAWPPADFVDREALDFGLLRPGEARSLKFQVRNPTAVTREVRLGPVEGADATAFEATEPGAVILGPGETAWMEIVYAPRALGEHAAELPVAWSPTAAAMHLGLAGRAAGRLEVAPGHLLMGEIEPGRSIARTVSFAWDGRSDLPVELAIESPEADAGAWSLAPSAPVLVPGVPAEVTVDFHPAAHRLHEAELVWRTSDPAAPGGRMPLMGSGGGPWIDVPATADLGLTAPYLPRVASVPVANAGTRPLTLLGASLVGDGRIRLLEDVAGRAIPRWSAGEVPLVFAPNGAGPAEALLRVDSDDPLTPRVEVQVRAQTVQVEHCDLEVPATLPFGYTAGGTGRRRVVTVAVPADAAAPCWIFSAGAGAEAGFGVELDSALAVAPGERLDLPVTFTPPGPGAWSATLDLRVGDVETPLRTVHLSGWSGDPWLTASSDALSFDDVPAGQSATGWLLVKRVEPGFDLGHMGLEVEGDAFEAGVAAPPQPDDPVVLVEVRYTPPGAGLHRGLLVLREGPGPDARPHVVTLYGTSGAGDAGAVP